MGLFIRFALSVCSKSTLVEGIWSSSRSRILQGKKGTVHLYRSKCLTEFLDSGTTHYLIEYSTTGMYILSSTVFHVYT